jgi:hypothetical protein
MHSRHALASAAVLLALAAPAAAHAQFGGLVKKAKNAAAEAAGRTAADKAVDKVAGSSPAAAAATGRERGALPGEPLTEQSFAAMLTGLRRADAMMVAAEADNRRMGAYSEQSRKIEDAHPREREFFDQKTARIETCQREHLDELSDKRNAAMKKRGEAMQNDPAAMARVQSVMLKYAPLLAAAQQKADGAEYNRLTAKMTFELTGEDPFAAEKADKASAVKACGTPPARPQWMAQVDSLDGLSKKAAADQRKKEETATEAGAAAAGGIGEAKFALLRERIEILYHKGGKNVAATDAETAIVERHRADLKAIERTLY